MSLDEAITAQEGYSQGIGEVENKTADLIVHPFAEGGTHLTTSARLEHYKNLLSVTYGDPESGLFLSPKSQIDDLLARSTSRADLEIALGLEKDALRGGRLVRIDVDNPFARDLHLPTSGNVYHRNGTGLTLDNLNEGVIDAPRIGTRGVRKSIVWGK